MTVSTMDHDDQQQQELLLELQIEEDSLRLATTICAAVAIVAILLTFVSYTLTKKCMSKRPHIIMVNLCMCLLIYFIAYLMGNNYRHHVPLKTNSNSSLLFSLCISSAVLSHFSILSSWMWIFLYWFVIYYMFPKQHISNFFIKFGLSFYFIAFLFTIIPLGVAVANDDVSINKESRETSYISNTCFIDNNYLYFGLAFPSLIFLVCDVIIIYRVFRRVFKCCSCFGNSPTHMQHSVARYRELKAVKIHIYKLCFISALILIFLVVDICIPIYIKEEYEEEEHAGERWPLEVAKVFGIIFCVLTILLGLMLMILFCCSQDDIRHQWTSRFLSKESSRKSGQSFNKSSHHGTLKMSPQMQRHSSTMVRMSVNGDVLDNEPQSSPKINKIEAKQDLDLSTLDMRIIPTTHQSDVVKRESNQSERTNSYRDSNQSKRDSKDQSDTLKRKKSDKGKSPKKGSIRSLKKQRNKSTNSIKSIKRESGENHSPLLGNSTPLSAGSSEHQRFSFDTDDLTDVTTPLADTFPTPRKSFKREDSAFSVYSVETTDFM